MSTCRGLFILDSITQIRPHMAGGIIVSGSHGGISSSTYVEAEADKPLAVFFNDAGVGKDQAGIAALKRLAPFGVLVFCYSHLTACIGQAQDGLDNGIVTHANGPALRERGFIHAVGQPVSMLVAELRSWETLQHL